MTFTIGESYIGLRYTCATNDWIDFTVIACKAIQDDVTRIIREVMDEFWESEDGCHGDMIEYALPEEVIFYHSSTEDEDEAYDTLLETIDWVAIN